MIAVGGGQRQLERGALVGLQIDAVEDPRHRGGPRCVDLHCAGRGHGRSCQRCAVEGQAGGAGRNGRSSHGEAGGHGQRHGSRDEGPARGQAHVWVFDPARARLDPPAHAKRRHPTGAHPARTPTGCGFGETPSTAPEDAGRRQRRPGHPAAQPASRDRAARGLSRPASNAPVPSARPRGSADSSGSSSSSRLPGGSSV